MATLPIECLALSPVAIAQRRGVDNVLPTLDYIPGSTWRGALAQTYIQHGWQTQDEFQRLFVDEQAWFGDLTPDGCEHIPLSALTCKYHGGFREENPSEHHGVVDTLIPFLRNECWGVPLPDAVLHCDSGVCKRTPLEAFRGFYGSPQNRHVATEKELIGHTQIHEKTHTASEGTLYMLETMREQQRFFGSIRLPDGVAAPKLDQLLTEETILCVGSDKTRGLGQMQLMRRHARATKTRERKAELASDLDIFNTCLRKGPHGNEGQIVREDVLIFPLTLRSRTIVHDSFLRYKSVVEPDDLFASDERDLQENCKLIRAWNATCPVDGWNSLVGFPKLSETAIAPGSVFVFAADLNSVGKNRLLDALCSLEQNGVGSRRAEGFGEVRVCDSFHRESLK